MRVTDDKIQFVKIAKALLAERGLPTDEIRRELVVEIEKANNLKWPAWLVNDKQFRIARGHYKLPAIENAAVGDRIKAPKPVVNTSSPTFAGSIDEVAGVTK